jgi:hypothetical protein
MIIGTMNSRTMLYLPMLFLLALSALTISTNVRADAVRSVTAGAVLIPGAADVDFTSLDINVPATRQLVINYSAECQVQSGYIEYDILVDGVEVPPTNDDYSALCASPAAPATVGPVVYRKVAAGVHRILVRGHVEIGFSGTIDDQSLVVEAHGP